MNFNYSVSLSILSLNFLFVTYITVFHLHYIIMIVSFLRGYCTATFRDMRFPGIPYIGQLLNRISFSYILITKLLPPGLFIYPDDDHEHFPLEFRNTSTKQPGKRSRYSDVLRAGQSGFPFPVGSKDFVYPDWPWGPPVCSNWYQGPHRVAK